ncbi:MAG: hypothetical protein HFI57_04600 [Lachnospiraceae bacterium]|nr:hypothetical protein [Lachnospiraceae bacterium]
MQNKKNQRRDSYKKEMRLDEFLREEDGGFDEEDEDRVTDDTLEFLCLDDETIARYQRGKNGNGNAAGVRRAAGRSGGRKNSGRFAEESRHAAARYGYEEDDYEDDRYEDEDDGYGDDRYEYEEAGYVDDRYENGDAGCEDDWYEDEEDGYSDDRYEDDSYEDDRYEDEEDSYEDDRYEDEEDSYEDDRYEDEEDSYEDDWYEDEEAGYEDEEDWYEDEDYEEDEYDNEYEYDAYEDDGVITRIKDFFSEMTTLDMVVAVLGIVVLAGALFTGGVYLKARSVEKQVETFASVGKEIEGISVIGESGLLAVAESARLGDMIDLTEEPDQSEEAEQPKEEKNDTVEVTLNLTSIQSDLKIKFVNKATGKLIGSVPFEVEVSGGKKNFDLKDEDKDGIIYQTGVDAGTYQVTIKPFAGNEYSEYKLPSSAGTVKVTDKIAYKKVDVADEVKTEAEVNAAAEDTAVQTTVESALKDTVEWVESTKTPVGEGTEVYEEVSKKDVPDPWTLSGAFRKMVEDGSDGLENITVSLDNGSLNLDKGESASLKVTVSGTSYRYTVEWSSSDGAVAAVSDGNVSAVGVGSATITARVAVGSMIQEVNCAVTVTEPSDSNDDQNGDQDSDKDDGKDDDKDNNKDDNKDDGKDDNKDDNKGDDDKKDDDKKDDEDNNDTDEEVEYTRITISGDGEVVIGKTVTLTAKTEPKGGKVAWSSDNEKVAKVDEKGVVTGVGEGSAKITAKCKDAEDITAEHTIKVKKEAAVDGKAKLKDKDGNQLYYKNGDGEYKEATYDDYKKQEVFYKKSKKVSEYKYTGWQTIDGHVYFYDKNGNYVTGEQVIQGAKYQFGSDGKLSSSSGSMGIDVSKWNGSIDWNAVKNSGVSYVIIRCGYRGSSTGVLVEDPKFRSNIKGAKAAGLKVGIYFFSQAVNEVEAVEEASMAVNLAGGYGLNYPIFLDVEASGGRGDGVSKEVRTAVCKAFCATVQNSGYAAGIYANKTWLSEKINTGSLTSYKIWLAQYASAPSYSATRYDMWQYSSKGKVSGISGDVDMNISYLNY